jgi:HAD superfamily hydrolase (TIGR01549 family)
MHAIDQDLRDKINNSTYVSFDIFNTAILRDVLIPFDVFELVQKQYESIYQRSLTNYAQQRQKSEKKARKKAWQQRQVAEVTFEEIFDCFQKDYDLDVDLVSTLKQLEIEAEINICHRNAYIFSLYRYCLSEQKKIVFISDMYLPLNTIEQILRSSGYTEFQKLFVSADFAKTKSRGDLYQVAIEKLECSADEILHIGDNYQSDIVSAQNNGLKTYYYEDPLKRSLKDRKFKREKLSKVFNVHHSLEESVCLAAIINKYYSQPNSQENNFWYDLGFKNLGILFLSFIGWLHATVKKDGIEKIFFLSRDGYIMKRVYDLTAEVFDRPPEAEYLYASRRALNIPSIKKLDEVALDFLASGTSVLKVSQFLSRAGLEPKLYLEQLQRVGLNKLDEEIITSEQHQKLRTFYQLIAEDIENIAACEREKTTQYLTSINFFKKPKIAVVDIGWHGSMQYSLTKIVNALDQEIDVKGYYFATKAGAKKNQEKGMRMSSYLCDCDNPTYYGNTIRLSTEIFEFIHSAPHGSVIKYGSERGDMKPVLEENDRPQSELTKVEMMHQGAIDFITQYLKVVSKFSCIQIPDREMAIEPLRRVLRNPTLEEAQNLGDIQHVESFGKVKMQRFIAKPPQYSFLELLRVDRVFASLKSSFWKIGYLKRLLARS